MVSRDTENGIKLFLEEPSKALQCLNCFKIMMEPVIMKCGHTFCKRCAKSMDKCINDGTKLDKKYLNNLALFQQTQELIVYCKYGVVMEYTSGQYRRDEDGCDQKLSIGTISKHELNCEFRTNTCRCGHQVRVKDTESHKKECQSTLNSTSGFISANRNTKMNSLSQSSSRQSYCSDDFEAGSEVQRISDNLTIRMRRFETQMNGTLARMEKMFNEMHLMFNTMMQLNNMTVINQIPVSPTINQSFSTNQHFNQSTRSSASISSSYPSGFKSRWINPFEFLNAGILRGFKSPITCCTMWGLYLLTGYHKNVIRVWDVSLFIQGEFGKVLHNGGCVAILEGHEHPIHSLHTRPYSEELVSFDKMEIRIWNLKNFTLLKVKKLNDFDLSVKTMTLNHEFLFVGWKNKVSVLSLDDLDGPIINSVELAEDSRINIIKLYPTEVSNHMMDQKMYCGGHNEIHVFDINFEMDSVNLVRCMIIKHQFYTAQSMLLSQCYIIIGTYNRNIQLFNRSSGEHLLSLSGHVSSINGLAITENESHLVSAGAEGYINIWELDRRTLIQSLRIADDYSANGVEICGEVIFVVGSDGEVKLFRYDRIR